MSDKAMTAIIVAGLLLLSFLFYALHFLLFQDAHHIWIYFLGDIAFIPIEVIVVTLILERLLEYRDQKSKQEKLHMVLGIFFSTMGTKLLTYFSDHDPKIQNFKQKLVISDAWTDEDFDHVQNELCRYTCSISLDSVDLPGLKQFLTGKEEFMARLLDNPFLMEQDRLSDLLLSVFHLTEELETRKDLSNLPVNDRTHLAGDICRVYGHLIVEWVGYVQHLKKRYPYLFSLALRTNPFDEKSSPIIA